MSLCKTRTVEGLTQVGGGMAPELALEDTGMTELSIVAYITGSTSTDSTVMV